MFKDDHPPVETELSSEVEPVGAARPSKIARTDKKFAEYEALMRTQLAEKVEELQTQNAEHLAHSKKLEEELAQFKEVEKNTKRIIGVELDDDDDYSFAGMYFSSENFSKWLVQQTFWCDYCRGKIGSVLMDYRNKKTAKDSCKRCYESLVDTEEQNNYLLPGKGPRAHTNPDARREILLCLGPEYIDYLRKLNRTGSRVLIRKDEVCRFSVRPTPIAAEQQDRVLDMFLKERNLETFKHELLVLWYDAGVVTFEMTGAEIMRIRDEIEPRMRSVVNFHTSKS
jgi:hypothetical protein